MYQGLAQHGVYDQVPFYEFGRSFWHWSQQLQFHPVANDPVVTGLAVVAVGHAIGCVVVSVGKPGFSR